MKINWFKLVIIFSVILLVALATNLIYLSIYKKPLLGNNLKTNSISPDILKFTQPILSTTGKVISVSNDSLRVKFWNETEYSVKVDSNTQITKTNGAINYLLKQNDLATINQTISLDLIRPGDLVEITSTEDLRTTNRIFTANSIEVLPFPNSISGVISNINNNILSIVSEDQTYEVTLADDVEISYLDTGKIDPTSQSTAAVSLSRSDLYNGLRVTIYTEQDVSNQLQIIAKRVEPIIVKAP